MMRWWDKAARGARVSSVGFVMLNLVVPIAAVTAATNDGAPRVVGMVVAIGAVVLLVVIERNR